MLLAGVILIASVGLTLLRTTPLLAWPFLATAVPIGSAALTWLTHSPHQLTLERARRARRVAEAKHQRLDRRVVGGLARHDQYYNKAEVRFRSKVGRAVKRATLDGSLRADDIESHGRILEQLCRHHLVPQPVDELHDRLRHVSERVNGVLHQRPTRPIETARAA